MCKIKYAPVSLYSPKHLNSLKNKLGTFSSGFDQTHKHCLAEKLKLLNANEKYINVMLDAIYIMPFISYKGGKIEGFNNETSNNEIATIVQTFMLPALQKNKAPTLNKKVVLPTSIERQNVNLCVQLFDEKTIAALETIANADVDGTIDFIKIILC